VPAASGVPSDPRLNVPAASPKDQACRITCIEKTSPAFVIPHVEEKHRVETDEDVMRDYYTRSVSCFILYTQIGVHSIVISYSQKVKSHP
jgi:hypothetical protein